MSFPRVETSLKQWVFIQRRQRQSATVARMWAELVQAWEVRQSPSQQTSFAKFRALSTKTRRQWALLPKALLSCFQSALRMLSIQIPTAIDTPGLRIIRKLHLHDDLSDLPRQLIDANRKPNYGAIVVSWRIKRTKLVLGGKKIREELRYWGGWLRCSICVLKRLGVVCPVCISVTNLEIFCTPCPPMLTTCRLQVVAPMFSKFSL